MHALFQELQVCIAVAASTLSAKVRQMLSLSPKFASCFLDNDSLLTVSCARSSAIARLSRPPVS